MRFWIRFRAGERRAPHYEPFSPRPASRGTWGTRETRESPSAWHAPKRLGHGIAAESSDDKGQGMLSPLMLPACNGRSPQRDADYAGGGGQGYARRHGQWDRAKGHRRHERAEPVA
jgi:hypothetical protein